MSDEAIAVDVGVRIARFLRRWVGSAAAQKIEPACIQYVRWALARRRESS